MIKAAARGAIPPFMVMDVMRQATARAAAGADILHLEVGQPGGAAPAGVREAAVQALASDPLGYSLALGIEPLRRRIARHYAERYGATVESERICITTGSSAGFVLAFLAAFEAGDRVAVAAPGYPAYRHILGALGVEVVMVPVGPDSRWQLTASVLDGLGGRLDGVVVASPSNPTGSMLSEAEVADLALWCERHDVRLISDEIYHGIGYDRACATLAGSAAAPHALVINSFSKYYAMTGWRLGWMVMPADLARPIECLQQNLFIAAPTLSQYAAIAAFDCTAELDARVDQYRRNRDILRAALPVAGFGRLAAADGAFYLYAELGERGDDSVGLAARLLAETGIAATPGVDFDPIQGLSALRFSYAGDEAVIAEAARRLLAWTR